MLHLNSLQGNLQEIYHAVKASSNELMANPCGTRVYHTACGLGRFWKWFYQIFSFFFDKEWQRDRVARVLVDTHSLFRKNLTEIEGFAAKYESYLKKCSQGYPVNEGEFFGARHAIVQWNLATRPFIKVALKNPSKIEEFFPVGPLIERSLFNLLSEQQRIINLEGITQGPLPLEIFEKICKGKKLSESDLKELSKWVKKLNKSSCPVRFLHKALQAIVVTINRQGEVGHLVQLESMLEQRGCHLFEQEDVKHILWRHHLKKGMKLFLGDKEITLGEQVGQKVFGRDRFINFAIEEMAGWMVIVGCNEAILNLKQQKHQVKNSFGVEPVQMAQIFDGGRYALVERLEPLNQHGWTSTSSELTEEDQAFVKPLVSLVKWLIEENKTPEFFSANYLMLNQRHELRSLKISSPKAFDFNALEDFVVECSNGNLEIYRHIMDRSGLSRHLTAKFYQEVVTNALAGEQTSAEDLAGIYSISDPKVCDRALKLSNDIIAIKKNCCMQILKRYPDKQAKEIEKSVNKAILQAQLKNRSSGIIWPTLEQGVLEGKILP